MPALHGSFWKGLTYIGEGGLGPGAAEGGQRGSERVAGADDLRHINACNARERLPRCQYARAGAAGVSDRLESSQEAFVHLRRIAHTSAA